MAIFSVIVPVYRAEYTIERCVDSIRKQTIKDIEIILVDDGNVGKLREKCDELAEIDQRIKVIHQKNSGPSVARNAGLKIATGQWIAFCDADDEMVEDACEKYLEKATENNCDVVIADIYRVSNEQKHIRLFDEGTSWESKKDIDALINLTMCYQANPFAKKVGISKFGYGGPWNKAIKLDLLKNNNIRFPENIRQYEDRLFNMHVFFHAKRIEYITVPVYKYYATKNSLTRAKASDLLELNQKIISEYKQFFAEHIVDGANEILEVMITERFIFLMRNSFSNKVKMREFVILYKNLKKISKSQIYEKAISRTKNNYIGGFDKYMVIMLKRHMLLLTCICYALRGYMGR